MKIALRICMLLIPAILLIFWLVVDFVLPYSGIKPFRLHVETLPEFRQGYRPDAFGFRYEPLTVTTVDTLQLQGYWIKTDTPRATLILLHGIADCKERLFPLCRKMVDIGIDPVLIDLRAHGQSEGIYCTFGAKEKNDIKILVDTLLNKGVHQPIGIYGNSLGGAVALQAMGLDSRLQFGVIESTFDQFPNVALEYGEDFVGVRSRWLTDRVIRESGRIAGFDPWSVMPMQDCDRITCPVFMAHGTADKRIPIAFGRNNFKALRSAKKEFHEVPEAGHYNLSTVGGDEYWNRLQDFLVDGVSN